MGKLSTRRMGKKTQIKLEYFFWFFSILFDSKMSSGGAPESWDEDLNASMSSLNVNATEFVPSWGMPPSANSAPVQSPQTSSEPTPANHEMSSAEASPMQTSPAHRLADSDQVANSNEKDRWEDADNSANNTPATTPEEEENSIDNDSTYVPASKPRTKVKVEVKEATTTEKEHVNVVFIGHVDAGKSTIGGQIMHLTGMVDKRTLEKYEREAKEKNLEAWYLSWCMDTNLEEREKGKTVEVGRGFFKTEKKHFTILDAPGHKSFVPNMIGGASQADLAVLVISARKGEFETGFERGGQTREHAMLVKTAGVKHMVVLINKMDDPTVKWDKARYDECKDKLTPYLKKVGFNPAKDVKFMPCSGLTGSGLMDPVGASAPWYTCQDAFIPYIDSLPSLKRNNDGPFMMPIGDKYSDMGTVVIGKVESGCAEKGQTLAIYPNRTDVKVDTLWSDDIEVTRVTCGENVKVKLKGVEESEITPGFVLCDPNNPIKSCKTFDAQVAILDYTSIICPGKQFVLHLQAIIEEVTLKNIICKVDKKTGEKTGKIRFIKQDDLAIVRFASEDVICMETFKDHPQLGRFTLRDEGKTIAIGKVLKLVD